MLDADVIVVGSGNAALCAAVAATERGADVLVVEKSDEREWGGNSRYSAGAMRFTYESAEDLLPLLANPSDGRLAHTDFGSYSEADFLLDLERFNEGRPLTREQRFLVAESADVIRWLSRQRVPFEPIYDRQSFEKNGEYVFWGGLTLAAEGEGPGLVESERRALLNTGGSIRYECGAESLMTEDGHVCGVTCRTRDGLVEFNAGAVVLGCGGFEADGSKRIEHLGKEWGNAKVRGTRHNTGDGLEMALSLGAVRHGVYDSCHAVPMDRHMPEYGNLQLPHLERKNYRKICYFLGIMINAEGRRFVDEGSDFRNYTYAQFGRAVLEQPGQVAWQLFDEKVLPLLYGEYFFHDASFVEADTLEDLVDRLEGVDRVQARKTIAAYNEAVQINTPFDPTILDGRSTKDTDPPRSNWANRLDTPPYRAYPVTGGITFTYGGLQVDRSGAVLREDGKAIHGLFACGELVGGVFSRGYPGGSGLTSGAVFGRQAGYGAAAYIRHLSS